MPVKQFRSSGPMTLNNYTDEEVDQIRNAINHDKIKYVTFIKEVGESGTPHLQIYAQAKDKLSVKAWHKILGSRVANIEPTVNIEAAIKYCQGYKDGQPKPGSDLSSVEEYGVKPEQGCRNDLEAINSELKKRSLEELYEQDGLTSSLAKYHQHWKDKDTHFKKQRMFNAARNQHNEYFKTRERLPWELYLDHLISQDPDPRHIHWFYDEVGETGKTVNAKNLLFNHNAFYTTGGKANDIYHAYQGEPIVILNLCASTCKETREYLYKVLEEFKDGIFSSGKYNSMTKCFKIPHVIVFSNEKPETDKMKKCRLEVHNVNKFSVTRTEEPPGTPEDLVGKRFSPKNID